MATTTRARKMRADQANRRQNAVAPVVRRRTGEPDPPRKRYARDTGAFLAPFVATWIAAFVIGGQGSRLTDLYWVGVWLVIFALLLFLPTRWRELRTAPKSLSTWWPLAVYLVALLVAYFAGTRLTLNVGLITVIALIVFAVVRWQAVRRVFQNLWRKLRKQPRISEVGPTVIGGSRWMAAAITVIAALVATLVAWPIYVSAPSRPFDAADAGAIFDRSCLFVDKDIAAIKQADRDGDTATLEQYNLLAEVDGTTVSFVPTALSDLETKRATC